MRVEDVTMSPDKLQNSDAVGNVDEALRRQSSPCLK
jgi:hypothetical protein